MMLLKGVKSSNFIRLICKKKVLQRIAFILLSRMLSRGRISKLDSRFIRVQFMIRILEQLVIVT
jgi:hypothetical protein